MRSASTGYKHLLVAVALAAAAFSSLARDPLPSWNEGPAKQGILKFVDEAAKKGGPGFIPPEERIATFDNDGTLWCEQPLYVQGFFVMDRVKALAPQHPEWKTQEPYASLLKGDLKGALAGGEKALLEVVMATHAGMTTDAFDQIVKDWIATAKHPRTGKLFTEMVYQPMLELLAYLRANGFKTFIVSGGGIDFMRPWTERVYGVPPEQVVGTSIETKYEMQGGKPVLLRLPKVTFVNNGAGKPEGIESHIGRRPVAAFGNSDGDREMLEWTQVGGAGRLMMLVHHDDAKREWAYGAESKLNTFSDSLMAEAQKSGWFVISMKDDWKTVFAFEKH